MIDSRLVLPQEFAGCSTGLPCARVRPMTSAVESRKPVGVATAKVLWRLPPLPHPYENTRSPDELIPFNGTHTMPWPAARARSTGALNTDEVKHMDVVCDCLRACKRGPGADGSQSAAFIQAANGLSAGHGVLGKVLRSRVEDNFHVLVEVLSNAMRCERKELDLREFTKPYSANNHHRDAHISIEKRRRTVYRTLQRYPLCNIYDLAICPARDWTQISRELGGVNKGTVMRCMMDQVQTALPPYERAAFWAAVSTRQATVEHGRTCCFARSYPEDFRGA